MRFTFIAAKKADHTVSILCRCLRVTRSGFYAWQRRPESTHARDDRRLKVLVRASFEGSTHRYGSPRVHEDLLEQQEHVSRKRGRADDPATGKSYYLVEVETVRPQSWSRGRSRVPRSWTDLDAGVPHWIRAANDGDAHSPETRAHLSGGQPGRWRSRKPNEQKARYLREGGVLIA